MFNKFYFKSILFIIVSYIVIGCGGGSTGSNTTEGTNLVSNNLSTGDEYGTSVTGDRADYNITVYEGNPIVGARLINTARVSDGYGYLMDLSVCKSFTDLGNGKYTLNECTQKPLYITAIGGFADSNGDGALDSNETTQNTPLILKTTILADNNLSITPLSTLAAGYASLSDYNLTAFTTKLGFKNRTIALTATSESKAMNQMVNGLLSAATRSGFDIIDFSGDLSTQMVISDGTNLDNLRTAIIRFINTPESIVKYGEARVKSLWNNSLVDSVMNGNNEDVIKEMLGQKIPIGIIRISGLVTTYISGNNILNGARVDAYLGDTLIGWGVSDRNGNYNIYIKESAIIRDSTLLFCAKTSTLKLTSSVPTNVLLNKRVNGSIDSTNIGSLNISYVTTVFNDNNNSVQQGATIKKLLFDSTNYLNKNINNSTFFIPLKIIYENQLIPGGASAPIDTEYLTKFAKNLPVSSMPYVLDVEAWRFPYVISAENDIIVNEYVQKYLLILNTLKAARPELKFGYWGIFPVMSMYGSTENLLDIEKERAEHLFQLTRSIVDAADFVAPGMYTYWDNPNLFTKIYTESFSMSYRYNKPIIPYLWAEYGEQTPMIGTYIPDNYWKYEVQFVKQYANGIAMWGGINFLLPTNDQNRIRTWDENISWWQILLTEFK